MIYFLMSILHYFYRMEIKNYHLSISTAMSSF